MISVAKDDYFILVYKLLGYLYRCLKQGVPPSWDILAPNTKSFPIGEDYFTYILSHLITDGHVEGIVEVKGIGRPLQFKETTGIRITPSGIEYLQENSGMKKAAEFLGGAGEIAVNVISNLL